MEVFDNIAISSRIRLARNVEGLNFFTKLQSDIDAQYITGSVMRTLEKFDAFNFFRLKIYHSTNAMLCLRGTLSARN